MPRKRNETNKQWMERIRAARFILNSTSIGDSPRNELAAFMELFHPDYPEDKTRELINSMPRRY
jgi:hypothetical protein